MYEILNFKNCKEMSDPNCEYSELSIIIYIYVCVCVYVCWH